VLRLGFGVGTRGEGRGGEEEQKKQEGERRRVRRKYSLSLSLETREGFYCKQRTRVSALSELINWFISAEYSVLLYSPQNKLIYLGGTEIARQTIKPN
jgi:hypothetical protein